jgi:hypothetical protein
MLKTIKPALRTLSLALVMLIGLVMPLGAQEFEVPVLTPGQPVSLALAVGDSRAITYTVTETSEVTLSAISADNQPRLALLRDNEVIASALNAEGNFNITLTALLTPGEYRVAVSTVNAQAGSIIVSVQSEVPVTITEIGLDTVATGAIDSQTPLALYRFGSLEEIVYLYVDSENAAPGLTVSVVDTNTRELLGGVMGGALGLRLTIPAGGSYEVEIRAPSAEVLPAPFVVCLTAVTARGCDFTLNESQTPIEATPTPTAIGESDPVIEVCTVSSANASGVNIRQSANVNAIIIGALPAGASADVLGRSPDGAFYNIILNTTNGWVAASVVITSGACDDLPTVQPPAVIFPTATPTNTPTPTPTPTATPEGPCLLSVFAATNVYTTTIEQIDYLYDQLASGGQLIPNGRTADNAWWRTNYAGAWIPTSAFGNTVTVSGNCNNLPVVTP